MLSEKHMSKNGFKGNKKNVLNTPCIQFAMDRFLVNWLMKMLEIVLFFVIG